MMSKKLEFNDPEFILMCAVDYVIHRHTYAPYLLVREIEKAWNDLTPQCKEYIKKQIIENKDDCDKNFLKIHGLNE